MRNEMGNTNTSGIQEEEGAAYTKAPLQAEEAAALSLNDPSSANDHNVKKLTSISRNEQDAVDKEHTSHFSEVQLEADSTKKSSDIQIVDSTKVERHEEPAKPKFGENNQSSIQSSTHTGEVANIDSNLDSESDPFTHISGPVQPLHDGCNPPSRKEENFAEVDDSCNDDDTNHCMKIEIEHTGAIVASGFDAENVDKENEDLMMKETASLPDRLIEEEDVLMSSRDMVENGMGNAGDEEGNLEQNLGETNLPSKLEEDVTEMNTLDCSDPASNPKEKCMILPQENKMASNEIENGKNGFPGNHTKSIEQEVNEFMIGNSAQLKTVIESHNQEKEEGYSTKENSISYLETESIEQQILVSNNRSQPHIDAKEATDIVPGEGISIVHNQEEEKTGGDSIVQKIGDYKDCVAKEREDKKHTFEKDKESCDDAAKALKFEAAGNRVVQNSSELPVNNTIKQIFIANEVRGILRPEKEQPQNVDATPGTISEHEMPSDLCDEQCANGIISPLPVIRSRMQETTRRYSVDYSSEQPGNQIETRRAPSFDFGIPFDARSSESDQTPLLRPDKPPTRRLSIDFQSTVLQTAYGRDSLDYDTMGVEEKKIRVERSDSDAPFLITLKKEENANLTEKTAESLLADMKEGNVIKNPPANELALASTKDGNGKRKPLPSFFSTCICCMASSN